MIYSYEKRVEIRKSREFSRTNKPWNTMKLNHTRNIGSLMFLIKKAKPKTHQEWAEYYFSSGVERKLMVALNSKTPLNKEIQSKLLKEYGRTEEELIEIAKKMKPYCNDSLELAYNYVYIRVIDETWIGYQKEVEAFNIVKKFININNIKIAIKDSDIETDTKYSVDFELYYEGRRILGIQLKSLNYKNNKGKFMESIKNINARNNEAYTKRYGVPVLYLYYFKNTISNMNELEEFFKIQQLIN